MEVKEREKAQLQEEKTNKDTNERRLVLKDSSFRFNKISALDRMCRTCFISQLMDNFQSF